MQKPKKVLTSKVVHKNKFYQIRKDDYLKANDKKSNYFTVVVDPFVIICPVVSKKQGIHLIRTWRYPLNRYTWELPAGRVDKNETPLMAAKRELYEEAGLKAKKWKSLGWFYISPGNSNQKGYVYLADRVEKDKHAKIDEEVVGQKVVTLGMFKKMIKTRKVVGAPTLIGAQRLFEVM